VPESVAVNVRGRSYTVAAGVVIDRPEDVQGVLFSQGTLLGGHQLAIRDGKLHYTYNWLGEDIQHVSGDADLTAGRHVFSAEFQATGRDLDTPSPTGTLTLYVDNQSMGQGSVRTQPGKFGLGSGLTVGRAIPPAPDPATVAPFPFRGGTIEGVVVDVSGEPFIDHEAEVAGYLARD
jgi:hypothetical protein